MPDGVALLGSAARCHDGCQRPASCSQAQPRNQHLQPGSPCRDRGGRCAGCAAAPESAAGRPRRGHRRRRGRGGLPAGSAGGCAPRCALWTAAARAGRGGTVARARAPPPAAHAAGGAGGVGTRGAWPHRAATALDPMPSHLSLLLVALHAHHARGRSVRRRRCRQRVTAAAATAAVTSALLWLAACCLLRLACRLLGAGGAAGARSARLHVWWGLAKRRGSGAIAPCLEAVGKARECAQSSQQEQRPSEERPRAGFHHRPPSRLSDRQCTPHDLHRSTDRTDAPLVVASLRRAPEVGQPRRVGGWALVALMEPQQRCSRSPVWTVSSQRPAVCLHSPLRRPPGAPQSRAAMAVGQADTRGQRGAACSGGGRRRRRRRSVDAASLGRHAPCFRQQARLARILLAISPPRCACVPCCMQAPSARRSPRRGPAVTRTAALGAPPLPP